MPQTSSLTIGSYNRDTVFNTLTSNTTPANMSDKEQPVKKQQYKKKPGVQSCMGLYLKQNMRLNKRTGRIETFIVEPGSDLVGDKHKCEHCGKSCRTVQGLGNHLNFCQHAKASKADKVWRRSKYDKSSKGRRICRILFYNTVKHYFTQTT
jgi:hypothetical protein